MQMIERVELVKEIKSTWRTCYERREKRLRPLLDPARRSLTTHPRPQRSERRLIHQFNRKEWLSCPSLSTTMEFVQKEELIVCSSVISLVLVVHPFHEAFNHPFQIPSETLMRT